MNIKSLQDLLTKCQLDAIIATTPENVRYFAGKGLGREVRHNRLSTICAIVDHDPENNGCVVLPHTALGTIAQMKAARDLKLPLIKTYGKYYIEIGEENNLPDYAEEMVALLRRIKPVTNPLDAILRALKDAGLTKGKLGIDELGISPRIIAELRDRLPHLEIVEAYDKIRHVRMKKTNEEKEILKRAIHIIEEGVDRTLSQISLGTRQSELVRYFNKFAVDCGAIPILTNFRIGPGGGIPDPFPTQEVLSPGELITYDIVLELEGYHADCARTAVLGEPTHKQRTYYDSVLAGQQSALEIVQRGTPCKQIFEVAVETIRNIGIPHYNRNDCGHGIGVEVHELPILAPDSEALLEADMVINVETPYYELGFGCVMVEDTVVVNEFGFEYLTHADRGLRVI